MLFPLRAMYANLLFLTPRTGFRRSNTSSLIYGLKSPAQTFLPVCSDVDPYQIYAIRIVVKKTSFRNNKDPKNKKDLKKKNNVGRFLLLVFHLQLL